MPDADAEVSGGGDGMDERDESRRGPGGGRPASAGERMSDAVRRLTESSGEGRFSGGPAEEVEPDGGGGEVSGGALPEDGGEVLREAEEVIEGAAETVQSLAEDVEEAVGKEVGDGGGVDPGAPAGSSEACEVGDEAEAGAGEGEPDPELEKLAGEINALLAEQEGLKGEAEGEAREGERAEASEAAVVGEAARSEGEAGSSGEAGAEGSSDSGGIPEVDETAGAGEAAGSAGAGLGVPEQQSVGFSDDSEVEPAQQAVKGMKRDLALQQIDRALADDVDGLLEGDYDAVSQVLDDVFDEQASIVQEEGEKAEVIPEEMEDRLERGEGMVGNEGAAEASPGDEGDEALRVVDALTGGGGFKTAEQVADAGSGQRPEGGSEGQSAQRAAPVGEAERGSVGQGSGESQFIPERPDGEAPEGGGEKDREAMEGEGEAGEAAAAVLAVEATSSGEEEASRGSLLGRVQAAVKGVLRAMNYPLRLVPAPLRGWVDWVALSLVFWVPVVWVLALFVIGK